MTASLFAHAVADVTRTINDPASLARRAPAGSDSNIGSAQKPTSNSASSLLSTLVPVLIVALVWLCAFLFLRVKFARRYAPRSFVSSLRAPERSPRLPDGYFAWIPALFRIPDTYVLTHHSLDGYLFLRFLRISVLCCIVGCLITWPVLFAVNATGGGGQSQLDIISMANVKNNYYRYFAHAGCAWIFFGFIMFVITRESIFYINLRQAYLMSPLYAERISARTVLFTSVPDQYLDEAKLRAVLGDHVVHVWIPTDTSDLEKLVKQRDKTAMKLEGAETKLITLANKARLKSLGKNASSEPIADHHTPEGAESGAAAARWIKPKQRPTHRLKPIIGKKVDTINWARAELQKLIPEVEAEQHKHRTLEAKPNRAAFVEFDTLAEAQAAYQSLTHHQVLTMAPRFTGMVPDEIIWGNLKIRGLERVIRYAATTAFVVALVVFWSIPVAFVGAISNVNYLIGTSSNHGVLWSLHFILSIPSVVLGVVTGLLPVVLLAVLMSLLPIILRLMARLGGAPTLSSVELSVQNMYFGFQVVQVFLVATLGSAASSAVNEIIKNPGSVTTLLSTQLPKASNFYLSYFVLQGLGVMSGLLVGLVGLVIALVLSKLLDNTPRKMFKRWTQLSSLGWGTVFPVYTNLFVIAICYACIAPLVLGFAAIGLYLFYFAYRYNFIFVYNQRIDTKGLVYPRALQHVFVGLYIAELCLIGLFAIKSADGGLGPLILMIVFLVFTALYQVSLNAALGPLLAFLPKTLQAEERNLLAAEQNERNEYALESGVNTRNGYGAAGPNEKSTNGTHKPIDGVPGSTPLPAPHKKPNFLTKFLKPHIYNDYATMRRLVPRDFADITYTEQNQHDAYLDPAVSSRPPTLWIPRDGMGVSRQEVRDTNKVIPISDEGASLDSKGKIVWNSDEADRAPVYEGKVYY